MFLMRSLVAFVVVGLLLAATSLDSPAPASPVVFACGSHYVKSVPTKSYDFKNGETTVYAVGSKADQMLYTFPWYSPHMELQRFGQDLSLVRFGGWPEGREASDNAFAIGFYLNDQELKTYSTLDLAGEPENVHASVSHHVVIAELHGFRLRQTADGKSVEYLFELTTIDGRLISFDYMTGEMRDSADLGELVVRGTTASIQTDREGSQKDK